MCRMRRLVAAAAAREVTPSLEVDAGTGRGEMGEWEGGMKEQKSIHEEGEKQGGNLPNHKDKAPANRRSLLWATPTITVTSHHEMKAPTHDEILVLLTSTSTSWGSQSSCT